MRYVLAALALIAGAPVLAPAAARAETAVEWVHVEGDMVAGRRSRSLDTTARRASAGAGFATFESRESVGTLTIRLRESYGVETLRPYVVQAAAEVVAATGMSLTVAPGTVTRDTPGPGEILLEVSSSGPCPGSWAGCGGPLERTTIAGRTYWASGQVWIDPDSLGFDAHGRQHVVSHELGHALGLAHYDAPYGGALQVMHSGDFSARSYRGGDRNGLAWLRPDRPPNDGLGAATPLGSDFTTATGANAFATPEPGEPAHAGAPAARSVWYRWTAPATGRVAADPEGTGFAPRVAVYAGTSYGALTPVASGTGRVPFDAAAGRTYSIAVDTADGTMGWVALRMAPDAAASTEERLVPSYGGTFLAATSSWYPTAWFRWTAGRTGPVTLATRGSGFDTVVDVHTPDGTLVARADDEPGARTTRLTFAATAGTTYLFRVFGYGGASGSVLLFVDTGIDRFTPVVPARILDSRAGGRAWGPGETIAVDVAGHGPVPRYGVSGVVLNVTAVAPATGGYLTVWPAGSERPPTSSLNFAAGTTVAGAVQAKLGPDGRILVANSAGPTHVVVDVVGYTRPDGENLLDAGVPARVLDSRRSTAWRGGETRRVLVTRKAGVRAVVLNVTATAPTSGGYLSVWPSGTPRPNVSSLNFGRGRTVANLVVAKVGPGGTVDVFNAHGSTHVVVDVLGEYAPAARLAGTTATPARLYDSRRSRPLASGETRRVAVTGLPPGAGAVALTVTATGPTAGGWLGAWPTGYRPGVSTLNFARGQTVANMAVVRLGATGTVDVFNPSGSTHFVLDVTGWYAQ